MTGIIVPVLEKKIFEFSFLGNGQSQDVVLLPAIDVGAWFRVRLVVRVHQINTASGNFSFKLQNTLPSDEDRQEFTDDTSSFLTLSGITAGSLPPNIKTVSGTDPQAYLKFSITATQVTAGDPLYGEFSAVLVLRET